jgi:phosphoglycolate phosphatase
VSRIDAVVLDVDGTVVTCPYDFDAMRAVVAGLAAEYGVRTAELPVRGVLEQIDAAQARLGAAGAEFARRAHRAVQDIELRDAASASFLPGAPEALAELRRRGLGIALITRNCGLVSRAVLSGLTCYDVLLARDDVPRPKPDPDHVLRSLACLGRSPAQAAMVGDHAFDMQAGRAARVQVCVGVLTGGSSEESLRTAGADIVLPSLADLPHWLDRSEGEGP